MSWLFVFLGFSALIVLHEAGHFFAAKATGMRVEKFFLFMGPKIVSVKRGETEYGIAAFPIGGYVKISGMNPEESLPSEVEHRAYYRKPVWRRIVVIAAGPAVNIVLALVILFVVALGVSKTNQTVGSIVPGSPAAHALRPGDRILAVDGKTYPKLDLEARLKRFQEDISAHRCAGRQVEGCRAATPVELRIERGGKVESLELHPEYESALGRTRIGFSYGDEPANLGPAAAAGKAASFGWFVTHETLTRFAKIFDSKERKQISGVVGVSDVAHQTIQVSLERTLILLAVVSLSLGLINLFPFLPLDGGHIFWSIVEKLRGDPVSLQVMERASIVGIVLVAMLFFIGLTNDIGRITGEGFNVR
jgi:regulator of sigma E protease